MKYEDDKCKRFRVCVSSETINKGYIKYHFENNYLKVYYGLKRKRRFNCDKNGNEYSRLENKACYLCSTLGFINCKNGNIDKEHDNEIICAECNFG